jgi:hypothetical protein
MLVKQTVDTTTFKNAEGEETLRWVEVSYKTWPLELLSYGLNGLCLGLLAAVAFYLDPLFGILFVLAAGLAVSLFPRVSRFVVVNIPRDEIYTETLTPDGEWQRSDVKGGA